MFYLIDEMKLNNKKFFFFNLYLIEKKNRVLQYPPTFPICIPADLHHPTGNISREK